MEFCNIFLAFLALRTINLSLGVHTPLSLVTRTWIGAHKIIVTQFQDLHFLLAMELSPGVRRSNPSSPSPAPRPNTLPLLTPQRMSFGSKNYLSNLLLSFLLQYLPLCFVTTRVPFVYQKTRPSMARRST